MMNLKWFAIGLGVGGIVAIFSIPKTGAETRQMLKDKAGDALRSTERKISENRYTIGDVINEETEVVTDTTETAADTTAANSARFRKNII